VITAACALVVSCKASVVRIGQPTTMPPAVTNKGPISFRSGKLTLARFRRIKANIPANAARPKVRVHGENPGSASFTIGKVNEKINTPRNA
jgi:hypothetical protein